MYFDLNPKKLRKSLYLNYSKNSFVEILISERFEKSHYLKTPRH